MILRKLTMKNFRQFQGVQEIIFASPDMTQGNTITIIFGENGRGKTGIYRAIMFCLYGDHLLSQDAHVEKKELHLVNNVELRKSASDKGKPIECFVELIFSHRDSVYTLQRNILGMLEAGETIEEHGKVTLIQQTPEGNTNTIEDDAEIKRMINSILDQRVREYFLFDGEKIERLTRASSEQRKEIAVGLKNLLDIDTLETAIKATDRLQKNLYAQLEKQSTGDYGKLLKKIQELSDKILQLEEKIKNLENEIELAVEEKRKIDKDFEKIKEISNFLTARNELEDKEKELQEQLGILLSEIKNRSGKLSLVLMSDTINNVFRYVDHRKQKGEIPSEIRKDLIEKIIADGRCLCGRDITAGSDEHRHIMEWKNRTNEVIIEDYMLDLWRLLSSVRNHFEDVVYNAETMLQRYALIKNEVEKIRMANEVINEKIGSSERADAAKLQKHRQQIEHKIKKLEVELSRSSDDLISSKNEYEKLKIQLKEKEREEGFKNELSKRAALALETRDALKTVYDEFTDEVKKLIGRIATEYFKELIDEQGRNTFHQIIVNEDYSIQILDRWGKPFLANISAGQRQIMSISFILALAKAAGKDGIFEMPFFMDTPFGRLSNDHRKNLILNIPKIAHQWVLLATDTEFRIFEARFLRQTGLWGYFYILKGEDGTTRIEKCEMDKAFTYLKNDEEAMI